jgi:riboflavin kinase / FMN adenylyltransferase
MKIFQGYRNISELRDPVAAIGIFDGMHIGHKRVVNRVLRAHGAGRDRVVVTFDPHPRNVLNPKKTLQRIMSLEHRLHILRKMGVDAAIVVHFSEHIARMSPEDFVRKIIVGGIGARTVYVGDNFHFGKQKRGSIKTFREIGKLCGVDVHSVRPIRKNNRIISSTWVRRLVSAGKLAEAEALLRRPVSVLGTVVGGDERGRTLGFPTANIDPHHEVIPPPGVYAVKLDINERIYDGVLNIGFKPTFYGRKLKKRKEPQIEVHVFDFKGNLYGLAPEIFFIEKLRSEKKFRSEEALKNQIQADEENARKFLSSPRISRKIKRYKYI